MRLRGVSFDVPEGDYISIMGPSGSGKSTLLNLLGCLDRPTAGEYHAQRSRRVRRCQTTNWRRFGPRGSASSSSRTICSRRCRWSRTSRCRCITASGSISASRRRCRELADLVGLGERLHHRPTQLSGGQQQRVAIARSLVNDPEFILADEPTGNLDSVTTGEILDLLERLNGEGRTIIMVTHEPDVAARTKRSIVLRDGRVVSDEPHAVGVAHPDTYKLV